MTSSLIESGVIAASLTAAVLAAAAVTLDGAIAGFLLAGVMAYRGGPIVLAAFAALVVIGTLVTRIGAARKRALGVAERRHGRRGAANALANAGPAAGFLLVGLDPETAVVVAVAALAAALADTISSEVGMLSRKPPRILLVGRIARTGEDGAMSLLGTAAFVVAAAALSLSALTVFPARSALAVFVAALSGSLVDSVLGATIERHLPRRVHNEIVNAFASAAGGVVALVLVTGGR